MMKKHRVGRVQLPWANLEPPIRSPNFYKDLAAREKAKKQKKEAAGWDKSAADGHRSRRSVDLGSVSPQSLPSPPSPSPPPAPFRQHQDVADSIMSCCRP